MTAHSAPTSTQQVVARLRSEGWVDCPHLEFPALSLISTPDLRSYILAQLQEYEGWMWKQDLELATLIFSIPAHEFQIHPYLRSTLKHLKRDQVIAFEMVKHSFPRKVKPELVISLVAKPSRLFSKLVS